MLRNLKKFKHYATLICFSARNRPMFCLSSSLLSTLAQENNNSLLELKWDHIFRSLLYFKCILLSCMSCMSQFSSVFNHMHAIYFSLAPSDMTDLDPGTIFKLLVGTTNVMWFDLFVALGVSYTHLEEIREQQPYDPNLCLYKSILLWLDGQIPKPSWKALADVLHFKMLQAKLVSTISLLHFSDEERAEEDRYLKGGFVWWVGGKWDLVVGEESWSG